MNADGFQDCWQILQFKSNKPLSSPTTQRKKKRRITKNIFVVRTLAPKSLIETETADERRWTQMDFKIVGKFCNSSLINCFRRRQRRGKRREGLQKICL